MTKKIKKIFKNLKNAEPSAELEEKILRAVAGQKERLLKRYLLISQAGIAVSLGVLFGAVAVYGRSFLDSDFVSLLKLIFSDSGVVFRNIGEFSLSLLETLPVFEIVAMIVPVFVLLLMASWYFKFSNNKLNHIT